MEDLKSRLDNCEREEKKVPIERRCESPCTISRNESNDLIALSDVQNKNEKLKSENKKLSQELQNLEKSLNNCENPELTVSQQASDAIMEELLS